MEDSTIEIRDDEINVEEIMAKIRENIRRRQAAGELPPDPDTVLNSSPRTGDANNSSESLERDLDYLCSNADIRNNSYFISSHRPHIGKYLVKGRQLVHGEIRRYVDPVFWKQAEWNATASRAFQSLEQTVSEVRDKHDSLEQMVSEVRDKHQSLEDRFQKGLAQISASPLSSSKENTNYFLFEERFRGSQEIIKTRQLEFLRYFEKCSHVLDIGCGRGEFLEILKDHEIGGIGVDSDLDMVAYCRSRQLEVEQSDALSYLETLEDKSLDGIFIDQVVEHLEPDYLIRLLALCYQKMKSGYYIVVETVNPLSFVSFVNFYIDMTHKRPVHPETLEYLIGASGFWECEKKFFSPVSEEGRLKKIERNTDINETERKNVDVYNHNVEVLNTVLFGAQDYAVVGKK